MAPVLGMAPGLSLKQKEALSILPGQAQSHLLQEAFPDSSSSGDLTLLSMPPEYLLVWPLHLMPYPPPTPITKAGQGGGKGYPQSQLTCLQTG